MNVQPTHLKTTDLTPVVFDSEEHIYRRHPTHLIKIPRDFFSSISTKDCDIGLSVNRSKFSEPYDIFWSIHKNDSDECTYILKTNNICIKGLVSDLEHENNKTGIKIFCLHTPEECNRAHCDLKFDPIISTKNKEDKINIKLFLNTVFSEIVDI